MSIYLYYNAKVIKIFLSFLLLLGVAVSIQSQEEDPIGEAIQHEKQKEDYFGPNLSKNEFEELNKIYTKYELTDREKELRLKKERGEKLTLMEKYRIGKSNRKDYLKQKKLDQLFKKKFYGKQSKETQERLKKNEKNTKLKYTKSKRKQKQKSFFNLFR